ncbi:MAG: sigma-70 family RNA polymerase sigma factor, partial [Planctomycetota bacterium]
ELVQKTWIAALRRPPSSARGARAWIRQVILNLARERHRRAGTRLRHEQASQDPSATFPDASESASREEIRELLADRLLALQEPYRSTLTLRYYEDLTSSEIAARLGVPAGTVRWRLKVGLDQLREELDRRCHGDRQRWVSALTILGPIGPLPLALERDALERTRFEVATRTAVPTWLVGLGGLVLTASLAGAAWFAWLRPERDGSDPRASSGAVASADDAERARELTRSTLRDEPAERSPAHLDTLAAPITETSAPTLRVRVVDANGAPVANAPIVVVARGRTEERARSDEHGEARLPFTPADLGALGIVPTRWRLSLYASAPGHAATSFWHLAAPLERSEPVVLMLRGPDRPLHGRVVDPTGAPVADALLSWNDPLGRVEHPQGGDFESPSLLTTTSAADGSFTLENIVRGTQVLLAFKEGFALGALKPGEEDGVEFVLRHGTTLSGRILTADGRPAVGVRVATEPIHKSSEWAAVLSAYDPLRRGFPEATRTDADGRYRLACVNPGLRTLWAGGESELGVATETVALEEGVEGTWDATLAGGRGLRLRLVDEDGTPLVGWLAVLRRPGGTSTWWVRRASSDEAGRVDVYDCPEGDLYLDVLDQSGLGATYLSKRLVASDEEELLTIATRHRATLSGTLLDHTGRPELGGKLSLFAMRTALTHNLERDLAGRFEQRLAPGEYSLVLQLERGARRVARFGLAENQSLDLGLLTLPAPGTLRIEALGLANGNARKPSYSLFALFEQGEGDSFLKAGTGDIEGDVQLSLLAGRYRVLLFDAAGNLPVTHEVTIEPFGETRLAR